MDKLDDIVQNWYDRNEGDISYDSRLLYFIELFQELKEADVQKENLHDIGQRLLFLLEQDFIDESLHMIYQRRMAEEINYAYRNVMDGMDEIEDEPPVDFQVVRMIEDGDTYVNNTDEPDIDLRGVDLGGVEPDDEEFIRQLGIKNE